MAIIEEYLTIQGVGGTYLGEMPHRFEPAVLVHISRQHMMDYPVHEDVEVNILSLISRLVDYHCWHEAFYVHYCEKQDGALEGCPFECLCFPHSSSCE